MATMKENYDAYLAKRTQLMADAYGPMFLEQEKRYVHPFHIYGPVWYVGDSWVCVHLIDTGDGLLLIDSGNMGGYATAMLIQAIWEAGFNPADVKWIIHSHGHVDHIGGANFFKRMFGTRLYLGAPDAKMFRERPELSVVQDSNCLADVLFVPDHEIQDGEELTFGGITMKFFLCPGHTEGVISCFFDVEEDGKVLRCGYYGGFGFNTLQKDFLLEIGDTGFRMRSRYLESIDKVIDEKVDIMLGNHCINNDTLGNRKKQLEDPDGPNPFIDPGRWKAYLSMKREGAAQLAADPAQK